MTDKLLKVLPMLHYINHCTKREQKHLISQAPASLVKILTNLCFNFNKGNLTKDPLVVNKFKPYRKLIATLCKKKPSIKKRRAILQTGGFLNVLLSTLIPLLSTVLSEKKK